MANDVRVSVALCTRNGGRFIAEQLQSIVDQSVLLDELLISDDASTDSTIAELSAFTTAAAHLPITIRVLRNQEPLGVTKNFQQAILACSGDIILLSDQDDIWSRHRVQRSLAAFDDPAVLLVHSDAQLVNEEGTDLPGTLFGVYGVDKATQQVLAGDGAFDLLLRRNVVTGATVAIRRTLVGRAQPFPDAWVHDEWLAVVAAAIGRIAPIPEPLIAYRQHDSNEIGAVRRTFRAKVSRLTVPGEARNARLLARAGSLADRYPRLGGVTTPDRLRAVEQKYEHEQARSSLSPSRLLRVIPVIREALTGRYLRYGGGTQDIVRDLVQPLGPPG